MVSDPAERKQLEDEAEAMRILDAVYFSKIRENKNIIEEQAKSLAEKDKEIAELKRLLQSKQVE
jgi:hypothetical protein